MPKKDLLSIANLEASELAYLINRTIQIAAGQIEGTKPLENKAVGIYFRKTSTRTRTSFSLGAAKLGAHVIVYGPNDLQTNTGETTEDTARVLSGYLDALVLRTAESIEEMKILASQNKMSVINAMSDNEHPTQAIADIATIKEHFGHLDGINILYFGEGNSTAAGLALAVSKIRGMSLKMFTPEGYGLPTEMLKLSQMFAVKYSALVEQYHSLDDLPKDVDVVYTTRWQTTGSSKCDPNWAKYFRPFSVTQKLMMHVSKPSGTVFMHDLPAVRGEDVSSEVLDGHQSIAFHQAHNKLFGAMAVLEWCILDMKTPQNEDCS